MDLGQVAMSATYQETQHAFVEDTISYAVARIGVGGRAGLHTDGRWR